MKELSSTSSIMLSILKLPLNWKLFFFVLLIIVTIATLNIITNISTTDSFADQQQQQLLLNSQRNIKPLSSSTPITDLGTEAENNNNWIFLNHDIYGTRSSN